MLIGASLSAVAQGNVMKIPLANASKAGLLEGFTVARTGKGAPAEWKVVPDGTAPGGRVLAQMSADSTDYRFPLAVYQGTSAANVAVTVRFKAISGQVDRAGGIAVRLADPDNYYVVRANALEGNVNFYRVVQGNRREIKGAAVKVTSGEWHTLGIRASGDRFAIAFDGKELFTANDKTFAGAGKIGLWTKADSITHFDALTVETLP